MINNMCSWLKRYIWRFIGMEVVNLQSYLNCILVFKISIVGMEVVNLQSYLNWFIYLHRCKRDNENGRNLIEFCAI